MDGRIKVRIPNSIRIGAAVVFERTPYLIEFVDPNGQLTLAKPGMKITASVNDVEPLEPRGLQLSRLRALSTYPSEHQAVAIARKTAIEGILVLAKWTDQSIRETCAQLGISISSLYRWTAWFLLSGCRVEVLIPNVFRFGRSTRCIKESIERVIRGEMPWYLKQERPPVVELHRRIQCRCVELGLSPAPSLRTIQRRVKALNPYQTAIARVGRKLANDKYRAHRGKTPTGIRPLEIAELDHSPVNLLCILRGGKVIRLFVTMIIDRFSRMVLALYVSPTAPSHLTIGVALSMAMQPKEEWLRMLGLSMAWPIYGEPEVLLTDSGREMSGAYFHNACLTYDIHEMKRPMGHPEAGGFVERLMGRSAAAMEIFPGKTFRSIFEKLDYDPEENASMTYEQVVRAFATFIDRYHHSPHDGLRYRTPIFVYREWISENPGLIGQWQTGAENPDLLKSLLPYVERTIGQDGVAWETYNYWGPSLAPFIRLKNPHSENGLYKFHYHPANVNHLYWQPPSGDGSWECLDVKDLGREEMALWDLKDGLRADRRAAEATVDHHRLHQIDKLRMEQTDEAFAQTHKERKAKDRQKAKTIRDRKVTRGAMESSDGSQSTDSPTKSGSLFAGVDQSKWEDLLPMKRDSI